MSFLRLFIILYSATCLALCAADAPIRKKFTITTCLVDDVHTTFLAPATPTQMPPSEEWPSVWVSSKRRICIPHKFLITNAITSSDSNAMTIIFPDMAVSAEEFSLYEQAMEDAIISLLVWQNLSTLYYSRKWTEERSYLPIGESLSRAGCFLYEKDIEDDRSKIATTLIDAYDGHLPKIIDPEDPGHLRILEKFVNPEDPYDTPECFLLLCTRKLALSKNNPTLRDATLCELWDGVCDDIRGTAPLFINWIYNYYSPSTPSSPSDPAAEIKSDDTDQRPLLLDIFDHTFYLALYRALEDCADSILKIPRRGSSQDPNPAERLWTRNLSSIAMSFYKEKEYEKAAALYAFIEIFSQDKFLYSHLAALARIFRFQAGNDPEATRCFEEAIKRGYPCHTPLARYLTEQGIKVKAEDDSSCCACCIMS